MSQVFAGETWDNAGPIDYPVLHIYACTSRLRHLCASPSRHNSQVHIRSNRGSPRCPHFAPTGGLTTRADTWQISAIIVIHRVIS